MANGYEEAADFDPVKALAERGVEVGVLAYEFADIGPSDKHVADAVEKLKSLYPNQVILAGTPEHEAWRSKFWSQQQQAAVSACIIQPTSAEEVAIALLICRWAKCKFAIKSGGHAAMKGGSNSDGGITIDLIKLNEIKLSDDKKTVRLGTGAVWMSVYEELARDGLTVAGGRQGDIGVGGFLLGGGISFFTSSCGWSCDTVTHFEFISAAGTIINVTEATHPDLFWALRGGGPNFGVVTRFDMETFPQGDIYAGMLLYHYQTQRDAVISAFSKLAVNDVDPKAAGWMSILNYHGTDLLGLTPVYTDPNPDADVFKAYHTIPYLHNMTKTRSLVDMIQYVSSTSPKGLREMWTTHTFKFDSDFLAWFVNMFFEELANEPQKGAYEKHLPAVACQILTKAAVQKMQRNGGNCLPLTVEEAPYLNLNYSCMWAKEADDTPVLALIHKVMGRAVEESKKRGIYVDYVYMNYASEFQDVMAGFGKNLERLKEVATRVDPREVFQKLKPGYFSFEGAPRKTENGL